MLTIYTIIRRSTLITNDLILFTLLNTYVHTYVLKNLKIAKKKKIRKPKNNTY